MIGFLIAVLVLLVVLYVVKVVVDYLELPPPIRKVVLLIVGLMALLWLLSQLGVMGRGVVVW